MDKDGDEDTNVDLEPSSEILSARSAKLQSNSAQTISCGGPAFCRYLYDAPSVNPRPVNHNHPVDNSFSETPKTASDGVFHVEASRRPPDERPGLLYFYGNGIQLVGTHTYPHPLHIVLNGKLHSLMYLENSGRSVLYTPATEVFRVPTMKWE